MIPHNVCISPITFISSVWWLLGLIVMLVFDFFPTMILLTLLA
jgi:hypothetical protein